MSIINGSSSVVGVVGGGLSNESLYSIFYHAYNLDSLASWPEGGNGTEEWAGGAEGWEESLQFWLQGVGVTGLSVLGIIGNLLSICVLSNKRMRSSISILLIGLAICDTINLFNALLIFGIPTLVQSTYTSSTDSSASAFLQIAYIVPVVIGIAHTAGTGSVFFTVGVTMERYLFICRPFLARRICTWERALEFSLGILVGSALMNLPRWWDFTCAPIYEPHDNVTVRGCHPVPTPLRVNFYYDIYYVHLFYLIVQVIGPLLFLIYVNTLIYLKIKEANRDRRQLSISDAKENKLAYMLFIVVAVFVASNILPLAGMTWTIGMGRRTVIPAVDSLGLFLVVFNASVNFAIYCLYGEKFRNLFLHIFHLSRCKGRGRQGSGISDVIGSQMSAFSKISNSSVLRISQQV